MGHAGAAQGLHQSFLHDAVFNVEGQLAGALLGGAPADAVAEAGDVFDLIGLDPLPLLRDGRGAMLRAFCQGAHLLYFVGIIHILAPFGNDTTGRQRKEAVPLIKTLPAHLTHYTI